MPHFKAAWEKLPTVEFLWVAIILCLIKYLSIVVYGFLIAYSVLTVTSAAR